MKTRRAAEIIGMSVRQLRRYGQRLGLEGPRFWWTRELLDEVVRLRQEDGPRQPLRDPCPVTEGRHFYAGEVSRTCVRCGWERPGEKSKSSMPGWRPCSEGPRHWFTSRSREEVCANCGRGRKRRQ